MREPEVQIRISDEKHLSLKPGAHVLQVDS